MNGMTSPTIVGPPGERIAVVATGFGLFALDVKTGAIVDNYNLLGSARNAPVVVKGTVLLSEQGNSLSQRGIEAWR